MDNYIKILKYLTHIIEPKSHLMVKFVFKKILFWNMLDAF